MNAVDLSGQSFGRLRAARRVGTGAHGSASWACVCAIDLGGCGAECVATCESLRSGRKQSCGCLRSSAIGDRSRKHGHAAGYAKTPEYQTWRSMRARCYRPSNKAFADYGGRGIVVCDRWRHDFAAFLADMGPRPSARHSIDRINNDGNYEPSNCRWARDIAQARNCRRNVAVEHGGHVRCIAEWAEVAGITYTAMRKRMKRGWPMEKAIAAPLRVTRRPCEWPTTAEVTP